MSNPPINASDPIFEKHALYIFKALQTVDGAQLSTEPGFPKPSSVQMQISRIAARWGLNIRATTGGNVVGDASVRGEVVTLKKEEKKQRAGTGRDDDVVEKARRERKSVRRVKARKREREFVHEEEGGYHGEGKPSPAKKRAVHTVWISGDEKEEGYGIAGPELIGVAETIEVD